MKIFAIGRNYSNHAKEMNSPMPEKPIFFFKSDTSISKNNKTFYYPDFSKEIHYELELVVRINRLGKNIDTKFASRYYNEIALGIDFTARDLQRECKKNGLPWEISKSFDGAAPISEFYKIAEFGSINNLNFHLEKNNITVQKGNSADMIFSINELISYLSRFNTLKIGDIIFTGTPEGVGPIKINDNLCAFLEDKKLIEVNIK
ncbi:MAG: fumarylacetoacetate hydrolase family protein [Bacteroidales bacterium]|jgi:acylpyruvate hydrolase|nr:fumarylacetoacetate hydrolase family protein [Bacteroidales bacterium]